MKKTLIILAVAGALTVPAFGAVKFTAGAKHVGHDVAAPFKYVGKGVGSAFKHLGQDMHIVKKAPVKKAGDGTGPIPICRPGTNCNPDDDLRSVV